MQLDIHALMKGLAERRPIFRVERDFQNSLSEYIVESTLESEFSLEVPSFRNEKKRLDIWLPQSQTLIELKYKTQKLHIRNNGKFFDLKNQSADDLARYDFLKDIQRLERAVEEGAAKYGFAIMLTNESLYWRPPPTRNPTSFDEFRIHEGRQVTGTMMWGPTAGACTRENREKPISLKGSYTMNWRDYSRLGAERNARFRYLAIPVCD